MKKIIFKLKKNIFLGNKSKIINNESAVISSSINNEELILIKMEN